MTLPNGPLSPPPACGVPMSPPLVNGDVGKSPLKQVSCFVIKGNSNLIGVLLSRTTVNSIQNRMSEDIEGFHFTQISIT
jgi:hypothetical protein